MPKNDFIALLILAFGGPNSTQEIEPFLQRFLKGRPLSPEYLAGAKKRYGLIGGKSPILEITERQARAIEEKLSENDKGVEIRTYVGMYHWHPFISDLIPKVLEQEPMSIVALSMSPFESSLSSWAYMDTAEKALLENNYTNRMIRIDNWSAEPEFVLAMAVHIKNFIKAQNLKKDKSYIVFTAHSIPQRLTDQGEPYLDQFKESASLIAEAAGLEKWQIAFQSKGRSPEPWLGPLAEDVLEKLDRSETSQAIIVPLGFTTDHLETFYDIDIVLKNKAKELGINLFRTETVNDEEFFIDALTDIIWKNLANKNVVQF